MLYVFIILYDFTMNFFFSVGYVMFFDCGIFNEKLFIILNKFNVFGTAIVYIIMSR